MGTSAGADGSATGPRPGADDRTARSMWIRTYRVNASGQPIGTYGPTVEHSTPAALPLIQRGQWPPCACPACGL
ncbi:hypothetical protein [Streptomyces sp. NPDC056401]|uniref:hypothetical protein n=1 Tax=Streptomyces sp. NPDC056401 TaxID=3345809 RepID=UPI0035DFF152